MPALLHPACGTPARFTWKPPATLIRTGECLVPTQLSWRRASQLVARGWGAIDPFHERWLGKLVLNAEGRRVLSATCRGPAKVRAEARV